MDSLDHIEDAAKRSGRTTERPSPKSVAVELEEGRRIVFRQARGYLRASVTIDGEPEAEVTVSLDRAIHSVMRRARREDEHR